ncbi:MAG: O-antigen ligase family protein [Oscillospiraceae bacterium]|nr:O-antigen ligase family protein [Oscillospiraceae bacterium]
MEKPQYIAFVCLFALISNTLAAEPMVYTIYALLTAYVCIHGSDLLPLMPVFACCYIAPSVHNNPGRNEVSVFAGSSGVYMAVLGGIIAAACIYRLVRDRKKYFGRKYRLLPGMLLLSAAYLLGGIGIPDYWENGASNLLFAFLQGASIWVLYLLFSGGVDWKKAERSYFAWLGFFLGFVLLLEILWIYVSQGVIENGVILRDRIYTGWGIHNNLGAMLVMMIPFAFYLATKEGKVWLGTVSGSLFLVGVFLSSSRNAILTGCGIYFICIVLMLYYASERRKCTIAALLCMGAGALGVILLSPKLLVLFSDILALGFDPNSRDGMYVHGMEMFLRYPIFGCSFFSPDLTPWGWSTVEAFAGFFPPRWHNTLVQLLASCGVVGTVAYGIHRVETVVMLFKNRSAEKLFIGCSVLALIICSLFDCHFFNVGPTLFYAMALAFAENVQK